MLFILYVRAVTSTSPLPSLLDLFVGFSCCACVLTARCWRMLRKWSIVCGSYWYHGVSCGVRVAPVIGQYLGLGCFDSAGWPGQHCYCPRNLGAYISIHYPLLVFITSSAWPLVIEGMWLRIVGASHTMSLGILGIC